MINHFKPYLQGNILKKALVRWTLFKRNKKFWIWKNRFILCIALFLPKKETLQKIIIIRL